MCVIVDPPLFIAIFKATDIRHSEVAPILQWVLKGGGKFVIGGTMYRRELDAVSSVLRTLAELEKLRKVVRKDNALVDLEVARVKAIEPSVDFDDPHLVALASVSGCRVVCILDNRAHRFLRKPSLYPSLSLRPKLYTRSKNSNLICSANIVPCCK
jgi:predicted nucleic acid-binding protein